MTKQINTARKKEIELPKTEKPMKALKDLNLIDDYMFDVATMDLEICKAIIELSLNIKIQEIEWKEGQKVIHNLPSKRGIRLDFYVKDIHGTIYNVEMQKRNTGDLPKRTRYYSAMLDAPLLKQGERSFEALPPTYVIVICGFDCFGYGKYRYTFQNRCTEDTQLILQNGLTTVFLNTKGQNAEEVEPELVAFLRFVENSTAEEAYQSSDPRIQDMYGKINHLKSLADVEADYMTAEEYRRMLEDDAREEGIKEGIQTGIQQGRLEMLIKFLQNGTKEEAQRLLGATEEEIENAQSVLQIDFE